MYRITEHMADNVQLCIISSSLKKSHRFVVLNADLVKQLNNFVVLWFIWMPLFMKHSKDAFEEVELIEEEVCFSRLLRKWTTLDQNVVI